MRICYIGDGESIHNHFMVDWFVKRGHDVLFLTDTPENAPVCEVGRVTISRGWGLLRHLYAAMRVRGWIQDWKPDVVHAHNVTGYGYWGALAGFAPLVMTAWGSDLNLLAQRSAFVRFCISHSLRTADLITGDAEALCQTARELAGKSVDARLLQWGVDPTAYDGEIDPEACERLRAGKEFVFISTRRLRPLYNIDVILNAYARAMHRLPSSRLLIVGDDHQKSDLTALVDDLGLSKNVSFLGWLSQPDLIEALCSSDAFISVPASDSTALSLLEAFAARLPVIVSDLPANYEWIEPGENGLFVKPGDVDALMEAMIEVAGNETRSREWGAKLRAIVETRGNRNLEMEKLEGWYQELLDQR